jgi:hypothetical protein
LVGVVVAVVIDEDLPEILRRNADDGGVPGGIHLEHLMDLMVSVALLAAVKARAVPVVTVRVKVWLAAEPNTLAAEAIVNKYGRQGLCRLGFLAISWGQVQASAHPVGSAAVLAPVAAGLVLASCFLAWERKAAHPMLPLPIFRSARFNVANTIGFCIYGGLCGAVFLTSQYFQIAQHRSPIAGALQFMPWPLPTIVVPPLAGSLAAKHGNHRFMAAGMAIQAVGLAWFAAVAHAHTPYVELCLPLVLSCLGIGLVFPASSGEVVASVRPDQMGMAAGTDATLRELGGVFGAALVGLVFASPTAYTTTSGFVTGFDRAILGLRGIHCVRSRSGGSRAMDGYCSPPNRQPCNRGSRERVPPDNRHRSQPGRRESL